VDINNSTNKNKKIRTENWLLRIEIFEVLLLTLLILLAEILVLEKLFFEAEVLALLTIVTCVLRISIIPHNSKIPQAFMIISLLRILSIGMPVFSTSILVWVPIIYGPIIFAAIYISINTQLRGLTLIGFLGFVRRSIISGRKIFWKIFYIPLGFFLGFLLAYSGLYFFDAGNISLDFGDLKISILFVAIFLFIGFAEELVYRYILQKRLQTIIGRWRGIILTSIIFSSMHVLTFLASYIIFIFLVSIIIGLLFDRTRSLLFVVLIHGSFNFFLYSFFTYGVLLSF
jgi:membrane protease YdiL (CAAX protease family)